MKLILNLFTAVLLISLSFTTFAGTPDYRTRMVNEIKKAEGKDAPKDATYVEIPYNSFICPTKEDAAHVSDMIVASRGRYTTQYLDMYSRLVSGTSCITYNYPTRAIGYITGYATHKNLKLLEVTWKQAGYPYPNISTGWVIPQIDNDIVIGIF